MHPLLVPLIPEEFGLACTSWGRWKWGAWGKGSAKKFNYEGLRSETVSLLRTCLVWRALRLRRRRRRRGVGWKGGKRLARKGGRRRWGKGENPPSFTPLPPESDSPNSAKRWQFNYCNLQTVICATETSTLKRNIGEIGARNCKHAHVQMKFLLLLFSSRAFYVLLSLSFFLWQHAVKREESRPPPRLSFALHCAERSIQSSQPFLF